MSGLLIAGKVLNIRRIGITLDTIQELGIPISEVAEDMPKRVDKHADAVKRLYLDGFISKKDWNFLNSGRVQKSTMSWRMLVLKGFGKRLSSKNLVSSFHQEITDVQYMSQSILFHPNSKIQ